MKDEEDVVRILKLILSIIAATLSILNQDRKIKLYWLLVTTYWIINRFN